MAHAFKDKAEVRASALKPSAYVVLTGVEIETLACMGTDLQIHHVIEKGGLSYNVGVAVAYLYRAGKKPGNTKAQDIEKAIQHLTFELASL
jgi:hypothetical protein